jgi:hypothetical protein
MGFFASIFFGWYFYLQARNKERMALIVVFSLSLFDKLIGLTGKKHESIATNLLNPEKNWPEYSG